MTKMIKGLLIASLSIFCLGTEILASTIDSIEITPVENNYNIILNSKDKIKSKQSFFKNKLILTLKNTKPANNFSMKYNSTDLENIIVKTDKNNTKVIIKSDRINPPVKKNNTVFLLFGLTAVGILFGKLISKEQEEVVFVPKYQHTKNIDLILNHKIKERKEEEKIKIAA